ncbi:PLC-like phosphodiesterase [Aspergillus bertholletiae]|uniref:Phosphoinositide phospholipase C n=1 Tax=Aspergillus bertholletiae TaxID=1226010 RepID=A0A5N7AUJ2_9EURO|nr:PLC-like phosphodiesterase [Aspergillus bertholletiae]
MDNIADRTDQITLDDSSKCLESKSSPEFAPFVASHLEVIYSSLKSLPEVEFLRDIQHETPDGDSNNGAVDPLASLAALREYMASPASLALAPIKQQNYSAPISNYFISSSHNTYLTGNQLYSDSDASAYTNVLLNGCRCVEIDVWDGERSSESLSGDDTGSTSNDSSFERKATDGSKTEKIKSMAKRHVRLGSISTKLGGLLGRKASPEDAPLDSSAPVDPATEVPPLPEPKVLHGHTLTKETTFRDVCYAIRDSAFVTSDLPVIVSLEVHASLEQQKAMVEIMEEAWKGMLVEVTPEKEATDPLPAPEELKRKILIKVKYVAPTSENKDDETPEDNGDALEALKQHANQGDSSSTADKPSDATPKKPSKILEALSRLAIFTKGFHFSHFAQPEAKVPGHVFSLSESAARAAHAKDPEALFEHNRRHFMRIYPYGLRVNSSNLDPSFFWRRGAQVVALNWQSLDKGMMLNSGMFADEQGWVLKPQGYLSSDTPSSMVRRQVDLSIEFLAGQNIPLPPGHTNEKHFHPYVVCDLHAETPDNAASPHVEDEGESETESYKQTLKSASGASPDFEGQVAQFPTLSGLIEELSFVRFKIKDDEFGRDSTAAWACIKLNRLQEGYRRIHLYDCSGVKTDGFLLVRIIKRIT